jgi:hypothetical protein
MVKESLVDFLEGAGKRLLADLDAQNMGITAAFWMYQEEAQEWRLILATPLIEKDGPISAYLKVREIIEAGAEGARENERLFLRDVALISPNSNLFKEMYRVYGTITDGPRHPIRRTTVETNEPIIYRLQRA